MQADSVVPNPSDTFSYDRYAYCRNNPVNLTDPTGHDPLVGGIIGAIVGAIMAALSGQNILQGAMMGFIAGAMFGVAGGHFWQTVAVGALVGATSSMMYGGNILQGAIIGAAGAAIGYGFGQMGGPKGLGLHKYGQGVLAVMSGGVVGGLSNVAMGGDFWQGFTMSAAMAGLSFAGSEIAAQIHDPVRVTVERQQDQTTGGTSTTYTQRRIIHRAGQRIELTTYIRVIDLNGKIISSESGFSAKYLGNGTTATISGKSLGHESADVSSEVSQMEAVSYEFSDTSTTMTSTSGAPARIANLENFAYGLLEMQAMEGVASIQAAKISGRLDFFEKAGEIVGLQGVSKLFGRLGTGLEAGRSYASTETAGAIERAQAQYVATGQTVFFQQ